MNRTIIFAAALLGLPLAVAAQEPKKYDLKLAPRAVENQKTEMYEGVSQRLKMSMTADGVLMNEQDNTEASTFAATEVITKVKEGKRVEATWAFSKATRREGPKDVAYGFQGKTVVVKYGDKGARSFAYSDGGAVDPKDLPGLKKAFRGSDEEDEKESSGMEVFAPKKPVAVGESWDLDMGEVARMMGGEFAEAVDLSKSKGSGILKAVETRDGAEFGKIELKAAMPLIAMGPMKLEKPLPLTMLFEMDICIDGSRPDGVALAKGEFKGDSRAEIEGADREFRVDVSMTMKGEMRVTTVK